MILHRSTPVTIIGVDDWMVTVRYPDFRTRIISRRVLHDWCGGLEIAWAIWRVREADACGRRQRRMAI
jgi:hypothetical protein